MIEYNADEVLGIAIRIEENGQRFYREAAGLVEDGPLKRLLAELADWEKVHIGVFAGIRLRLPQERQSPELADPDSESVKYLNAVADGKVFNLQYTPASETGGKPGDILRFALDREKDSVIFYLAMREVVPSGQGRGEVEKIIDEEMSHIRFICEKMDTI